jgi:hypothetical protein
VVHADGVSAGFDVADGGAGHAEVLGEVFLAQTPADAFGGDVAADHDGQGGHGVDPVGGADRDASAMRVTLGMRA